MTFEAPVQVRCESKSPLGIDVPCELEAGHDGLHRCNAVKWHDPPLLLVDGQPPDLRDSQHWIDGQVVFSHEEPPL